MIVTIIAMLRIKLVRNTNRDYLVNQIIIIINFKITSI